MLINYWKLLKNNHKMVKVLYFGRVREDLGISEESYEFSGNLNLLLELIKERHQNMQNLIEGVLGSNSDIAIAKNLEYLTTLSSEISNEDEIAFIPPISGG
ncbi:unnamed protein product [Blepharisma stoltei]|uniref:Molybdopterin synthase sulfur carrier subunit n=1 Tax=Blepharisma stoltei TaxID=1481888 RepID=A0AAU9I662_9CILI|nr:unnamed protein product [Blepharisma stoltei]